MCPDSFNRIFNCFIKVVYFDMSISLSYSWLDLHIANHMHIMPCEF